MSDRIQWHRSGEITFDAKLADPPHDAWARLALWHDEWLWRVFWERRFDRWGTCADRQEASDQANAALQELLATTVERQAAAAPSGDFTQRMYGRGIMCHPERLG